MAVVTFENTLRHQYGMNMRCMRSECGQSTYYDQATLQKRWGHHRDMPIPLFNRLWRCPVCGEKSPGKGAEGRLASPPTTYSYGRY